jgi:hypothetical protein
VEHDLNDLQPHDELQVQFGSLIELGFRDITDVKRGDVTYQI